MSHKEIEARFIKFDPDAIEKKLAEIGAKKVGSFFFREWLLVKPEWKVDRRRIRVRTDGTTTWLTYKANKTYTIDSTEEIETTVSSADDVIKLIQSADVPLDRYQEKKRTTYELDGIIFDLDFWPKIPPVLEIESSSEEKVREGASLLGFDWNDVIFEDQKIVHLKYYGVDLDTMKDYRF